MAKDERTAQLQLIFLTVQLQHLSLEIQLVMTQGQLEIVKCFAGAFDGLHCETEKLLG